MSVTLPKSVAIDSLYYLFSLVRWHRDMGHTFCRERPSADQYACLYAVDTNGEKHMISYVNVLDEIDRFVAWVDRLES